MEIGIGKGVITLDLVLVLYFRRLKMESSDSV
jgi:hypothetical protein